MTTESKATASTQDVRPVSGPEMIERALKAFQAYEQGKYDEARPVFVEYRGGRPVRGLLPHGARGHLPGRG